MRVRVDTKLKVDYYYVWYIGTSPCRNHLLVVDNKIQTSTRIFYYFVLEIEVIIYFPSSGTRNTKKRNDGKISIWRVPPLEVSAESSSWTGLAKALTCTFSPVICGKDVPPRVSIASRKERTYRNCESAGPSPKDPFLAGAFGLHGPNVNHYEDPSVMADLIDWTLVNVSSWLAFVVGD